MRLISTRSPRLRSTFLEAIQGGTAPDGGLWMPDPIACFRDVEQLLAMDPGPRALEILGRLLCEEVGREELAEALGDALDMPMPLVAVARRTFAFELFHGPTLAFKDVGARVLARLLALADRRTGSRPRTVLTATSGDTGAAAAHAFHGQPNVRVVVLYPKGRISADQERLFATLGGNVRSFAVEGSFDDCQALVKGCFQDEALVRDLALTSANSLNVARLLGQIVTYFEAASRLWALGLKEPPVFAIPCGNFGNLTAGLLAQKMGLKVKAFVVATNANDVVPAFLEGGPWAPGPSKSTLSNAMDVGDPSNWERVKALLGTDREALKRSLRWGHLDDAATRQAMGQLRAAGYRVDPHGAVAYGVLQKRLGLNELGIFLATAHPAKFRDVWRTQMNEELPLPPELQAVQGLPILSEDLPVDLESLKAAIR